MISIKEFLVNASIIITIIYISSLLHKQLFMNVSKRGKDILFAIVAIFAGWCSMFFGIHLNKSVIFDLRFVPIIIASLHYRNPIYIGMIGFGIGLLRFSFGFSQAATIGFLNMAVLSVLGIGLFFISKKWRFTPKMISTVTLLNFVNIMITMGLGVISLQNYMDFILPTVLPANILLSLLLLWIVHDLKMEYFRKMDLMKQANKDPLTKVFNRRGLMQFYHQLAFDQPEAFPLSVAFMDLDHFKKINDQYGHLIGDKVLKDIAQLIAENLNDSDIIGRFGGEEFVVLLPNCTKREAVTIMEKIRHTIEKSPVLLKEETIHVTMSIGISSTETIQPKKLLAAADDAVYIAKSRGRNMVFCAEGN